MNTKIMKIAIGSVFIGIAFIFNSSAGSIPDANSSLKNDVYSINHEMKISKERLNLLVSGDPFTLGQNDSSVTEILLITNKNLFEIKYKSEQVSEREKWDLCSITSEERYKSLHGSNPLMIIAYIDDILIPSRLNVSNSIKEKTKEQFSKEYNRGWMSIAWSKLDIGSKKSDVNYEIMDLEWDKSDPYNDGFYIGWQNAIARRQYNLYLMFMTDIQRSFEAARWGNNAWTSARFRMGFEAGLKHQ